MEPIESILIYGPDDTFNAALTVELGRRGVSSIVCGTGVEELRSRARVSAPDFVFLDCQFIPGWGLDMLYALHKLFPKAALFLCANKFSLNHSALKELGVQCYLSRSEGLPVIVNQLLHCLKKIKDPNSNVS